LVFRLSGGAHSVVDLDGGAGGECGGELAKFDLAAGLADRQAPDARASPPLLDIMYIIGVCWEGCERRRLTHPPGE